MSDPFFTEIGLERTPCFGPCPVFRVTFLREGSYLYVGRAYVAPLGEQSGRCGPHRFGQLAELVRELGILDLDDLYPREMDDTETAITTVGYQGGVKVVRNEGGGPTRLWAFENLVEKMIWDVFRHESYWGRRGKPSLDPPPEGEPD